MEPKQELCKRHFKDFIDEGHLDSISEIVSRISGMMCNRDNCSEPATWIINGSRISTNLQKWLNDNPLDGFGGDSIGNVSLRYFLNAMHNGEVGEVADRTKEIQLAIDTFHRVDCKRKEINLTIHNICTELGRLSVPDKNIDPIHRGTELLKGLNTLIVEKKLLASVLR